MSDYKKTLHLPVTAFPMKANLVQREPEILKKWQSQDAYGLMVRAAAAQGGKGRYVLHDGPPYANGHIHMGTALNKILKDIVVRSRNMQGFAAEFVPGWDCHGLPIELKVEHELGEKKQRMPAHAVRKCCRQYAEKYIAIQRKEFQRLGCAGTWDSPYMSMDPVYEAATLHALATVVEKGHVARSKKPIYWCCSCQTALAEAEVEYDDRVSPSIYVRFSLHYPKVQDVFPAAKPAHTYIIIWTTTPWTLPNNMAVAVHPDFEYALVEYAGTQYVLVAELVASVAKACAWKEYTTLGTVKGAELDGLMARHPLYDRAAPIVLGEHVTLDAGTGCVHTAPGHGREDYEVALKYGLEVYSPLDDAGRYLDSVGFFAGLTVFEANPKVMDKLRELGHLLGEGKISHSYPHCWRCKGPVIFRATTQWFIGMDVKGLRQDALDAIRSKVRWIPAWGEERIHAMIALRPDWCISRQRQWGVPIVALLCESCGEAWNDPAWMHAMADRFAKHPTGCDYWYETDIADIIPHGLSCPQCGAARWKKETDILDVWFDSGTSFAAVVELRKECDFPADLYLEGSDQHRGWFHSSLLAAVATRGAPPYKSVLTHGYVVDGEGRKMSKSIGNVIAPQELIDKFGADIIRLWVSSVEYREDIRISDEILNRLVDAYRRIRNTCRYLLGNLNDFTPEDAVDVADMEPLDRYALHVAASVHARVQAAYADFEFHKVFHTLHNFCVTDLSAVYLDIIKDRLYAAGKNWRERRSAQSALWHILMLLVRDMAPVLSFTAEEVFGHIPEALRPAGVSTVFALPYDDAADMLLDTAHSEAWAQLLDMRAAIIATVEPLRKSGVIGHSLDARVLVHAPAPVCDVLRMTDLRALCIVSQIEIHEAPELHSVAERALGTKCERCWIYSTELGTDAGHPTLCPRCTKVIQELAD